MADKQEFAPEEENQTQYEPVVKLQEVQIATGEEDDEVLYKERCALYRFDSANNEWKERGKGDVKMLKNKSSGKVRLLLRQDKTGKLCMNHNILPEMNLSQNAGSDRSWVWACLDFSEGKGDNQVFAIRFKNADIAKEFKTHFESAQKNNASADEEAEEASAAGTEEDAAKEESPAATDADAAATESTTEAAPTESAEPAKSK